MTEVVKTARLRLREPTERKKERIQKYMRICREIARLTANRIPSIPSSRWGVKTDNVWAYIVSDVREEYDINYRVANEVVEDVRSSFASWKSNGYRGERPKFEKANRIPYRKNFNFFEKNETYYVNLPFKGGRKNHRDVFPFLPGAYQDFVLRRVLSGKLDYGSAELIHKNGWYMFNLSVKEEVNLDYEPQTFIGVDVGLNILAWAVAVDEDGTFLNEIHFKGGEASHIRDRYNRKRRDLQKAGNIRKVKELRDREARWMENKNHTVSSRIVAFASQFEKPLILLEDINAKRLRERTDNPRIHSWRVGDLQTMITYKAHEEGIKVKEIPPQYTSQTCPKCGHTDEDNRPNKGIHFKCVKCGYENHVDFVGGWNIARGIKKTIPEVCELDS